MELKPEPTHVPGEKAQGLGEARTPPKSNAAKLLGRLREPSERRVLSLDLTKQKRNPARDPANVYFDDKLGNTLEVVKVEVHVAKLLKVSTGIHAALSPVSVGAL